MFLAVQRVQVAWSLGAFLKMENAFPLVLIFVHLKHYLIKKSKCPAGSQGLKNSLKKIMLINNI